MKKKAVLLLSTVTSFGLVAATFVMTGYAGDTIFAKGETPNSLISLSSSSAVEVSPDDPLIHQVNVRNNKFDVVGYQATGGNFGSIQKVTLGNEEYRGMVYNRSAINGFESLTVKYSGGALNYVFTDFLMEDMTFAHGQALVSEEVVSVPSGKAYFIIYTTDENKVDIDYVNVSYSCDGSIDAQMIYNKNTTLGNARSMAKSYVQEDSFIEIENNPTKYTNNYSLGAYYKCSDCDYNFVSETIPSECPHCHSTNVKKLNNSSWYRWNGKYFTASEELGTDFTFGMTVMGNYDRMVDESKYFHYAVWPQFTYGNAKDRPWVQTYIGNDNYEPLGKDHALRPSDPNVNQSYAGRFFTDYNWYNEAWQFADPDTVNIAGGSMTFREAYEAFNMPFWHMKFHVYLDRDNDPMCDISINGMLIYSDYMFENYDKVNTPSISIYTMPMHVVNYGLDAEGNPAPSYKGWFTYPRLIETNNSIYLKGTFNSWSEESSYKMIQDVVDSNHFVLKDVELTAGDELKVNDVSEGGDWYTNNHTYNKCHFTIKDNGNICVSDSGTYDVHFYLNSEDGNHVMLSYHTPAPQELTYTLTDLPSWIKVDNADIYAWVWGPAIEDQWVEVNVDGTTGTFTVNYELTGFKVGRFPHGTTDLDFSKAWNQSGDIVCASGVYSYSVSIS